MSDEKACCGNTDSRRDAEVILVGAILSEAIIANKDAEIARLKDANRLLRNAINDAIKKLRWDEEPEARAATRILNAALGATMKEDTK